MSKFVSSLVSLGKKSGCKAVDVFLSLHGSSTGLFFAGNKSEYGISPEKLKDKIIASGAKNMRALYSTLCYGADHAPSFIDAVFKVASCAIKTNANVATEYPFFVGKWILGWTYKDALAPENDVFDQAQDALAKTMGFPDADSTKKIFGNGKLKITSA